MIKRITTVIALCSCLVLALTQNQNVRAQQSSVPTIDTKALWQPGMQGMADIRKTCGSAPDFGVCFAAQMQKEGASPQAVAFTKLTDNTGFLRDFKEAGRVDIAYVNYPFRANENQGCLLVNGSPRTVDVDDTSLLSQSDLAKNSQYTELAKKYPNIAIFPGDRSGTNYPVAEKLPGGGQRFIVSYWLLNGCHACERVGEVSFAFNFDGTGKFTGAKLQTLGASQAQLK